MATIKLEIKRCMEGCPNCKSSLTKGYGYATDYHCGINDRLICGYVEWDSELKPVPNWCPIREGGPEIILNFDI